MLEGVGMSKLAGKTLTEDQVLLIAKALGDRRFLSTHTATYNSFNVQRHLISAKTHRAFRAAAMNMWHEAVTVV